MIMICSFPGACETEQHSNSHSGTAHIPLGAGPDINSSTGAGMGTGRSRIIALHVQNTEGSI